MTTAWVRVDGAQGEDMFPCEGMSALACDVVVGIGAVFEGVTSGEVVMGETLGSGSVQLPMAVMVFLPSINADEKRGCNWSMSPSRVVPFKSQSGECS